VLLLRAHGLSPLATIAFFRFSRSSHNHNGKFLIHGIALWGIAFITVPTPMTPYYGGRVPLFLTATCAMDFSITQTGRMAMFNFVRVRSCIVKTATAETMGSEYTQTQA
jgi:hypothetical protein